MTLNTHFDPIALWFAGSQSYSQVWWFSKFCNSFSMTSFYWQICIGSNTASLYVAGLCILLLISMADIILFTSTLSILIVIVLSLRSLRIFAGSSSCSSISVSCKVLETGANTVFWSRPYGLSFPISAFCLSPVEDIR